MKPTSEASKLADKLESSDPFTFFSCAYAILAGSLFGGRSIRAAVKKKYEGKISCQALIFPELPTRVRLFGTAFKETLWDAFPKQGAPEFYRLGAEVFDIFVPMCEAEWARSQG